MENSNKKRKTSHEKELFEQAYKDIIEERSSVSGAAKKHNIPRSTLRKFVIRKKQGTQPFKHPPKILCVEEETKLSHILEVISDIFDGITSTNIKNLAYEWASINCPEKIEPYWSINRIPGPDWYKSFTKRYPNIKVIEKKNKEAVVDSLKKCHTILEKHALAPSQIWHIGEKTLTTKQDINVSLAPENKERIANETVGGTKVVTLCVAANAEGTTLPCLLLCPNVPHIAQLLRCCPTNCYSKANVTGWMQKEDFRDFMQHFIEHTKPSKENPIFLLFDNFHSHFDLETIVKAERNGIVMLASEKLKPLHTVAFNILKAEIEIQENAWLSNNPGQLMTTYDLFEFINVALPVALSKSNVEAGFIEAKIYPKLNNC